MSLCCLLCYVSLSKKALFCTKKPYFVFCRAPQRLYFHRILLQKRHGNLAIHLIVNYKVAMMSRLPQFLGLFHRRTLFW